MLKINSCLYPFLFDLDDMLYFSTREKLLTISRFAIDMVFPFFPKIKLLDIVLSGSICSYTYTQNSDLDIFIVVDDLVNADNRLNARIFYGL